MKLFFTTLIAALVLAVPSNHLDAAADLNPNLIIFTDELENFIESAFEIYQRGEIASSLEQQRRIEDLIEIGYRIANLYYLEISSDIRPRLEAYLKQRFEEHRNLQTYFIILGNAFVDRADHMLREKAESDRQIRRWATTGGAVLGLASGTGVILFKPHWIPGAVKQSLLVIGLGAAGAGAGYLGGAAATSFILPANPAIESAKDFLERYPAGEDFIRDILHSNHDLLWDLSDLNQEVLYESDT